MAEEINYKINLDADAMEQSLKNINQEINDLNKSQTELEKSGKKNSQQYKDNAKAIDNNKNKLNELNSTYKQTTKGVSSFSKASRGLKNGLGSMGKMISGPVSKAFKAFGTALKANPVMFIIGIIMAVVAVMKKILKPFQPLLDWISDKIAYVSGLIDGFMSSLSAIGDIIGKVFSGDFSGAADAMGNMADNIQAVAEAQENLNRVSREQDAIAKENALTTAESMARQKELETIIKDTTKSEIERTKALNELKKTQKDQAQDDVNEKMARYNAINQSVNASLRAQQSEIEDISKISSDMLADLRNEGKLTEDQFDEIVDSRNAVAKANEAAANVDTKLVRYDAQLKRERETEAKKQHQAYLKRQEEKRKLQEEEIKRLEKVKEFEDKINEEKLNLFIKNSLLEQSETARLLKGKIEYYDVVAGMIEGDFQLLNASLMKKEKAERESLIKLNGGKELSAKQELIIRNKYDELFKIAETKRGIASAKNEEARLKFIEDLDKKSYEYKKGLLVNDAKMELQMIDASVMGEEEKAQKKAQIRLAYSQKVLDLYIKEAEADGKLTDEEIENIKRLTDEKIKAAGNYEATKVKQSDIDKAYAEEGLNMALEINQMLIDDENRVAEEKIALSIKDANIQNKILQDKYDTEASLLKLNLENGIISQEEHDKQLLILQNNKAEEEKKIKNKQIETENNAAKSAFEANKKSQLAGVIMNTAQAIMSIWSGAGQLGPIAGPILAGIQTAFIGGVSMKKMSDINSQQFTPTPMIAAGGGILNGPLHAAGGINMGDVEGEGGEMLINRASTKKYTPLLNSINSAGNTKGDNNNVKDLIDYKKLAETLQSKKVYVVSSDITEKQDIDVDIINRTSF